MAAHHPRVDEVRAAWRPRIDAAIAELVRASAGLPPAPAAEASMRAMLEDAVLEPVLPTIAIADGVDDLVRRRPRAADDVAWLHTELDRADTAAGRRLTLTARNIERALARTARHLDALPIRGGRPRWVADVRGLGQETHNGGQRPVRLTFDTGVVIYKPVCLASDALFASLLRSLAIAADDPRLLRAPRYAPVGSDYGFVEYLEPRGVGTQAAAERFFFRLGVLVAVAHGLSAADLHMDNLLAIGEHPVLIDLEAFPYRFPAAVTARDVTMSGLIERRVADHASGSAIQGGGVREVFKLHATVPSRGLRAGYRQRAWQADNRLRLGDRLTEPSAHAAVIANGFDVGYRLVCSQRGHLLATAKRIAAETEVRVRHMLRFTAYYVTHIYRLLQPSQADPAERRQRLVDQLWADDSAAEPPSRPIVSAEADDLLAGDVPYFWAAADQTALRHHAGMELRGYFPATAIDALGGRLDALDDDDRGEQAELLAEMAAAPEAGAGAPASEGGVAG